MVPDLGPKCCKGYQQTTLRDKELTPKEVAVGLFHCKNMCKFTPKEVAAELLFTVKCV